MRRREVKIGMKVRVKKLYHPPGFGKVFMPEYEKRVGKVGTVIRILSPDNPSDFDETPIQALLGLVAVSFPRIKQRFHFYLKELEGVVT